MMFRAILLAGATLCHLTGAILIKDAHRTSDELQANRSLKVAIATIAPYGVMSSDDQWVDAFAVLAHSIRSATRSSIHTYDLLAIVPDDVKNQEAETRGFAELGWKTRYVPIPVRLAEIKNNEGREILSKVLGENEELKYYGANFTEYDRVLVVDGDTMFLKPFDELMQLSPKPGLVGVYDHEMDLQFSSFPPVNSGFLLITPSATDFKGLCDVFREGDIGGMGFRQSGTGYTYGAGSQGMFSFFYNQWTEEAPGYLKTKAEKGVDLPGMAQTRQPTSSRFYPVDRSAYNVIQTDNLLKAVDAGNAGPERVKVFHFAGACTKPWMCDPPRSDLCEQMQQKWWALRAEVENARGRKQEERCRRREDYQSMHLLSELREK